MLSDVIDCQLPPGADVGIHSLSDTCDSMDDEGGETKQPPLYWIAVRTFPRLSTTIPYHWPNGDDVCVQCLPPG